MKKDKKVNQEIINQKLINDAIKSIDIKYDDFKKYFNNNFYEWLRVQITSTVCDEDNESLQLGMKVDNLTLKYLCGLARNGDIDAIILLVDKFSMILRTIKSISKIKKGVEVNDEDLLINAIENYQGDKMFSLHLASCYRELYEEKKESFQDRVKRYSSISNNVKTVIDDIIRALDIYEVIPESEDLLKKFVYLKYGYYENYFFQLEHISEILEIDISAIINLYKKSLILAKDISDSYLEDPNYKVNKK